MDYSRALSIWNGIYIAALATTVIATLFLTYYSRRLNSDATRRIAEVELASASQKTPVSSGILRRVH